MPLYISLVYFTEQGLATIEGSPDRLEAAKAQLKGMGGEIKAFYLTLGRYNAVAVVEAPDDESIAKFSLATGRSGNVRTEVLRAFDEDDYRKIVSEL
jgi:uncharacterized protein with GYD domain